MITSVEIFNFLSHKKNEIPFDNGVTVFIGENGAGKSSVIDAITFSLFGKTTRGTQETLFKDGESQAYTKSKFQINGKGFQVLKQIQKNGAGKHEIFDESGTIIAKSATEVTKEISNRIGLDYDTLKIASIVPQGELTDIIQSDNGIKLRSLIDKVMGAEKFLEIEDRLKKGIKEFRQHLDDEYGYTDKDVIKINNEIDDSEKIVLDSNEKMSTLQEKQIVIKKNKNDFEREIEKLKIIESKKLLLDEKENSIWNTAKSEISRLSQEKDDKANRKEKCEPCLEIIKGKTKTEDLLNMTKEKKIELENEIVKLESSSGFFKNRKEIADKIGNIEGECPICHSKDIDPDPNYQISHIEKELLQVNNKKIEVKSKLTKINFEILDLERKNNEIVKAENTLENFAIKNKEQIEDLNNDIISYVKKQEKLLEFTEAENITGLVECIPDIKQEILQIEELQKEVINYEPNEFQELKNKFDLTSDELEQVNQQIGQEKNKIDNAKSVIDKKTPILKEITLAKEYIAKLEEIQSRIFSTKSETFTGLRYFTINRISENASQYLEQLKTKIHHVKLQQEGNNSVKIECDTISGSRPIKNLSGGEAVCVALAIRLGMAEMMIKSPLKMMVLDEPTAALDPKHREYFVDAIQQLTKHLSENQNFQFIIITHNEDIWDAASATVYKFEESTDGTIVKRL